MADLYQSLQKVLVGYFLLGLLQTQFSLSFLSFSLYYSFDGWTFEHMKTC